MTSRVLSIAAFGLIAFTLTACPKSHGGTDSGDVDFDAGNPAPIGACSGGCNDNQVCDTARRTCVSGCTAGCDAGVCLKNASGGFQCTSVPVITCGGATCGQGQIACLGGQCSCLASALGTSDSCSPYGQWCNGGVCTNPQSLEQCVIGGPACPTGNTCQDVFGNKAPICVKSCTGSPQCNVGEICFSVGCLPSSLTSGQECTQQATDDAGVVITQADGGVRLITVPVSNTCLLKDDKGNISNDSGKGLGNCTYAFLKFFTDGLDAVPVCHAPGTVAEGGACSTSTSRNTVATQCNTGLTCVTTKGGDQGQCFRACNANPPKGGFTPTPACNAGETCVNEFRYTDPSDNSVLGACMQSCNVFDATKNTCAKVGGVTASCVPTSGNGSTSVSSDGSGLCIPQLPTVAALGAACSQPDAFHGAACGSGQLCTSLTLEAHATCVAVCDTGCTAAPGTAPARCETEPNARCTGGLTCKATTSTTGANVGFCE